MALTSPLRKEMEQASRDIDTLNRLYNVYFQGGEENPPRPQRKALDASIDKIKSGLAMATNAADKFQANTLVSRYRVMCARWDKILREIDSGTMIRPKRRE